MKFIKSLLDKVLGTICIILFALLVLLVTWQVITRFIFNEPSTISEELAKYCFVWLSLFGTAYVFGENGHMAIEFVKDRFPKKLKIGTEIFIELVIIAFSAVALVKGGLDATNLAWTQISAALQIPVGYLYSIMPICGVIIIFYCIYHIYLILTNQRPIESINEQKHTESF
jgi:TRAP-type transport system small permease protein